METKQFRKNMKQLNKNIQKLTEMSNLIQLEKMRTGTGTGAGAGTERG